jgi:hypothetical protein
MVKKGREEESLRASRRWGDLLAYLAVGVALVAATGAWWLPSDQSAIFAAVDRSPYWIALVLLASVMVWRLGAGRWGALVGLRDFRGFPPPWVAVVGALGALSAWLALRPADVALLGYRVADGSTRFGTWPVWGALAPAAGAFLVLIVAWVVSPRLWRYAPAADAQAQSPKTNAEPSPGLEDLSQDFGRLCTWLRTDDEIRTPADDRFGHRSIAARVARHVRSASEGDGHQGGGAIALLGKVGSGKSSTLELVRHELALHAPNTIFLRSSLWVFDSAQAAVAGVLNAMLEALGKRVSVIGLQGLPEAYLRLMSSHGGLAGTIAQALRPRLSPDELLKGIGEVLTATGLQLVVAIEDLERFAEDHEGRAAGEHAINKERVAPIQALLHLLHRLPQVTVLLAAASLETWPELAKLARYIERVPTLEPEQALPILRCFHQGCLRLQHQDGGALIDDPANPSKRQERQDFLPGGKVREARAMLDLFPNTRELPWALAELCAVPRVLKLALREGLDVWEQLRGELDLEDLLAISLLRHAEPEVFAWVEAHLSHLRGTQWHREGSTGPNPGQQAEQALDGIVGAKDASPRRGRVDAVLEFIFPQRRSHSAGGKPATEAAERAPQGFAMPGVEDADYWRRYLRREPIPYEQSDQRVLRVLTTWQQQAGQDRGALVALLNEPGPADKVLAFARLFRDPPELQRLLEQVVEALPPEARPPSPEEGFVSLTDLWKVLQRRDAISSAGKSSSGLGELIVRLVKESAPRNLTLAWELTHLFATPEADEPRECAEDEARPIREALQGCLVRCFVESPEPVQALLAALRGSDWRLLDACSWTLPRNRKAERSGLPFERWPDFVATVVAAAQVEAQTALPQLLPFMVKDASSRDSGFDEEAARRLLGTHYDEVVSMFRSGAAPLPPPDADPAWRAADAAVRTHAKASEPR